MADDSDIERIPIKELRQEEGAHELASSPDMKPVPGVHQGGDAGPRSIAGTGGDPPVAPGETICLAHRFRSQMGPCRLHDLSVEADRCTLTPEEFAKVVDLLKFRPMQLAIVLKVLVGQEEMVRMVAQAIGVAKRQE